MGFYIPKGYEHGECCIIENGVEFNRTTKDACLSKIRIQKFLDTRACCIYFEHIRTQSFKFEMELTFTVTLENFNITGILTDIALLLSYLEKITNPDVLNLLELYFKTQSFSTTELDTDIDIIDGNITDLSSNSNLMLNLKNFSSKMVLSQYHQDVTPDILTFTKRHKLKLELIPRTIVKHNKYTRLAIAQFNKITSLLYHPQEYYNKAT